MTSVRLAMSALVKSAPAVALMLRGSLRRLMA